MKSIRHRHDRLSALIYGTTILVNLRLDQIMMAPALAPCGPPAVTYSVVIGYNLGPRDQSWG